MSERGRVLSVVASAPPVVTLLDCESTVTGFLREKRGSFQKSLPEKRYPDYPFSSLPKFPPFLFDGESIL